MTRHDFWGWDLGVLGQTRLKCVNCGMKGYYRQVKPLQGKPCY